MKSFIFLIGMIVFLSLEGTRAQDQERLRSGLFSYYEKRHLPSSVNATKINLSMSLHHLRNLDLFQGTVEMTIWLKMTWQDSRLQWDPSQFGDITIFRTPSSDVWIPDVTLYNSHESLRPPGDVHVLLYSDGTVYFVPPMQVKAACQVNIKDYPYDTQSCLLKWGSWVHDASSITLETMAESVDLSEYYSNPKWDIVNTSAKKNSILYPCCDEIYEDVAFSFELRRRLNHGHIAPAVVAVWFIVVSFFIGPSSAGYRVTLGGFVFVSLVVLTASLSAEVPAYSETKLGRFLLAGIFITVIITAINAFIGRFSPDKQKGEEKYTGKAERIVLFVDIASFAATVVILAIITGALFA